MLMKLLLKKILPSVVAVVLLVLAGLWLYGYCGVKFDKIGLGDYNDLNCISKHGADVAGGVSAATGNTFGL